MNRAERRATDKKVKIVNIIAVMDNGSVVHLDLSKISIIDKGTKKPLFK